MKRYAENAGEKRRQKVEKLIRETDVTSPFHGESTMWNSTLRATALITAVII